MNTPGSRMDHYVKKIVGVNVEDFADIVGVTPKTIYSIIGNDLESIISKGTLKKIFKQFSKFPWEWIKAGGKLPDVSATERGVDIKPECEECKVKDQKIEHMEKEMFFLNGRISAFEKDNERLEKQLNWMDKELDILRLRKD